MTLEEKLKKRVTAGSTSNTTSTRVIGCYTSCGNWEEMPADQPRDKVSSFSHQRDLPNGEAFYNCNQCGSAVLSQTIESNPEIEVKRAEINVSHRWTENDGCLIQRTGWSNYEGVTISITGKDAVTPVTFELTHEQAEMLKAVL